MARAALRGRLNWQRAAVRSVTAETHRATRIALRPPAWGGHRPGQHVDVRLTAPDGYTARRSYSIASAPETPGIELVVERLDDGEVSPFLTGELRAGDQLELRGPVGGYFLWPEGTTRPVQLIAGGSGVVPFLSMLAHQRATSADTPVRLLYSARGTDDVIGHAELGPVSPTSDVTLTYTRTTPPGWTGPTGRIGPALLAAHAFPAAMRPILLVCGPTAFVESVANNLVDLGHDPAQIKTERFGGIGDP